MAELDLKLFYPSAYRPVFTTHPFGEKRTYRLGYHEGVDLRAPTGTKIFAAMDGIVQIASMGKMYGNQVWMSHDLEDSKIQTVYAHLDKFASGIKRGKRVKRGELIGYAGSTGNSDAAHLHFGLRINGKWIDPEPYLVVEPQG